ncbi:MAG TPA: hypothetical protein DE147_03845 [Gammaproteobacteria bacterium]|nr:hypothetical protein [Gammaproteobacteria bacterium]
MKHEFVPASADSRLDHVGSYRRRLPVSLDRMYENALDWQHLPYLHSSSFGSIDCESAGAWGWRAKITADNPEDNTGDSAGGSAGDRNENGQSSTLELRLDREARRWITRNLAGPNGGAEIWTHVFVVAERTLDIVVDFFVPDVPAQARDKVGMAYAKAYDLLYDEDVQMMTERQRQLDQRLDGVDEDEVCPLGRARDLQLPVQVTMSGRNFVVNTVVEDTAAATMGNWVVYPAQCPHQLGPLHAEPLIAGTVRCPWHGYVFDVETGNCVSGSQCRLGRVPLVIHDGEDIELRWQRA